MKFDSKDIAELLQNIEDRLGYWGIIIFAILIVFTFLVSIYLKYLFKTVAEQSSKRTIEELKSQLTKSLQTQIGLFFRDESIRNSLLSTVGQKSFEKKIQYWQLSHSLYFNYQNSWNFAENTDVKEYVEIDVKLNELRTKIFNETVYLGYDLSQKLLKLNSLMREGLRMKETEFAYSGKNYQPYTESKLKTNLGSQSSIESKISDLLYDTEKWIMQKLHSDQTIEKFEFTPEQLEKIKTERTKQFKTFNV